MPSCPPFGRAERKQDASPSPTTRRRREGGESDAEEDASAEDEDGYSEDSFEDDEDQADVADGKVVKSHSELNGHLLASESKLRMDSNDARGNTTGGRREEHTNGLRAGESKQQTRSKLCSNRMDKHPLLEPSRAADSKATVPCDRESKGLKIQMEMKGSRVRMADPPFASDTCSPGKPSKSLPDKARGRMGLHEATREAKCRGDSKFDEGKCDSRPGELVKASPTRIRYSCSPKDESKMWDAQGDQKSASPKTRKPCWPSSRDGAKSSSVRTGKAPAPTRRAAEGAKRDPSHKPWSRGTAASKLAISPRSLSPRTPARKHAADSNRCEEFRLKKGPDCKLPVPSSGYDRGQAAKPKHTDPPRGRGTAPRKDLAAPTKRAPQREGPQWATIDFDREVEMGRRIGGGGLGVIYEGRYDGRRVAIKTLFDPNVTPKLRREFTDELLVMSRLSHPNVVRFHGASTKPPRLFFAMELCRCSLFDRLYNPQEGGGADSWPAADRVRTCLEIATGMEYLHSRRPCVVHRDLKSHNVLIADDGGVRLCDFGLVRAGAAGAGTPHYQAPELLRGGAAFTKSVDVYAFAVVAYEVFARNIPFFGCDVDELRLRVCRGDRAQVPVLGVPPACRDLIRTCWDQSPQKRPTFACIVETLKRSLEATLAEDVGRADEMESAEPDLLDAMMDRLMM